MKWEDVQTAATEAVMQVKMRRLVEALRFYGDAANHVEHYDDGEVHYSLVRMDEGAQARSVLRELGVL